MRNRSPDTIDSVPSPFHPKLDSYAPQEGSRRPQPRPRPTEREKEKEKKKEKELDPTQFDNGFEMFEYKPQPGAQRPAASRDVYQTAAPKPVQIPQPNAGTTFDPFAWEAGGFSFPDQDNQAPAPTTKPSGIYATQVPRSAPGAAPPPASRPVQPARPRLEQQPPSRPPASTPVRAPAPAPVRAPVRAPVSVPVRAPAPEQKPEPVAKPEPPQASVPLIDLLDQPTAPLSLPDNLFNASNQEQDQEQAQQLQQQPEPGSVQDQYRPFGQTQLDAEAMAAYVDPSGTQPESEIPRPPLPNAYPNISQTSVSQQQAEGVPDFLQAFEEPQNVTAQPPAQASPEASPPKPPMASSTGTTAGICPCISDA